MQLHLLVLISAILSIVTFYMKLIERAMEVHILNSASSVFGFVLK